MNFICETVKIVESNIMFNADVSYALHCNSVGSGKGKNLWLCCSQFTPKSIFTAKYHINQIVCLLSITRKSSKLMVAMGRKHISVVLGFNKFPIAYHVVHSQRVGVL